MPKPPHSQRGQNPTPPQQQRQQIVATHEQWSGPLPPPNALERYNSILPNGAERVVTMAEKEQAHRIDYEGRGLTASVGEARIGQILGAVICLAAIGAAAYTASIGVHWAIPVSLATIPLLGIVRAFVSPRK